MIKKVFSYLKVRPFLSLLTLFLVVISVTSLKPDFYLVGWDNYSSYLDTKLNFFRLFFATWRSFRGFGVPSDAEVVDIWRLLFQLALKMLFIPTRLLDQLYYLLALWSGVIGMYSLASFIHSQHKNHDDRFTDVFSFVAAFFYLFNINTLSIFYFPLPMFVTRFFALPLIFYILLKLVYSSKLQFSSYLVYCLVMLFTAGSYLIPTVFITVCIAVLIFLASQGKIRKGIAVFVFFLLLNCFWILPFLNYTFQKSATVQLAPTFIDGNEDLLNKNQSDFGLDKQLIFYPQFFTMSFNQVKDHSTHYFHDLASTLNNFPHSLLVLYLFPVLYLFGAALLLLKYKRFRQHGWLPLTLLVFLFLSLKEYSALGFLYNFFSRFIPYFSVIFRFSDTKFHAHIAFAGSITAAFAIEYLYYKLSEGGLKKILPGVFAFLVVIPTLFVFRTYFNGNFIGFFMYNRIPQAYFDLAEIINKDPLAGRIVQLPTENGYSLYWKSYSWGYFGSAFFHYLVDKPLFDKTFSPASQENALFDEVLQSIQKNYQSIALNSTSSNRLDELYTLLKKSSVRYLIFDETISTRQSTRGLDMWGNFNSQDVIPLLQGLRDKGYIQLVKEFPVNLEEYANFTSESTKQQKILLYRVANSDQRLIFIDQIQVAEEPTHNGLRSALIEQKDVLYDNESPTRTVAPFLRNDAQVSFQNKEINYQISLPGNLQGAFTYSTTETETGKKTRLIQVYVKKTDNDLIFNLYEQYLPNLNDLTFLQPLGSVAVSLSKIQLESETLSSDKATNSWHIISPRILKDLKIRINDTVLPVAAPLSAVETYSGSVIVRTTDFNASILQYTDTQPIDVRSFISLPNESCFGDKLGDYEIGKELLPNNTMALAARNGSLCLLAPLQSAFNKNIAYAELALRLIANQQDLDSEAQYGANFSTAKPQLKQTIQTLAKPQYLKICVKEDQYQECYNKGSLELSHAGEVIVPIEKNFNLLFQPQLMLVSRNLAYQKQLFQVINPTIRYYQTIKEQKIFLPQTTKQATVELTDVNQLQITFTKPISTYSDYIRIGKDSLEYESTPCGYYRTIREMDNSIIGYVEQCDNRLFKELPFSSDNFYLWQLSYNLASGQFPQLIIMDKFNNYLNEKISLYNGYPQIPGFNTFQSPEFFTNSELIKKKLTALTPSSTYVFIYPAFDLNDAKPKSFNFKQYTENEGLFQLAAFNIVELPNDWPSLALTPLNNSQKFYSLPARHQSTQILPSLWRVTAQVAPADHYLLRFNEGYDTQWGIYPNGKNGKHYRCNGYANCFEISSVDGGEQTFYIFYWPELLAILGWTVTIFSTIGFGFYFIKNKEK